MGMGMANQVTGWFNSKYAGIDQYFHLKKESDRIHRLNDSLLNAHRGNFLNPDTTTKEYQDSIPIDTIGTRRRYLFRDAEVVSNSVNFDKNYIQLNRGSKQGVRDNMGVLNSDLSLIGIVVNTSGDFSTVMSLLHVQSKVSAMMKRSGSQGIISWDGKNPGYLTMSNVPKSDSIGRGDTILTGLYSYSFPPKYMIGTVESIVPDNTSSFYTLRVKPAANFHTLQHVFIVENLQMDEQAKLEKETIKKMETFKN